jgi:MFS family permease
MAVQGGFVAGTLGSALLNLPDVLSARRLAALGSVAGAVANWCVTIAPSPALAILARFATGVALACVYPPGMKLAASWVDRHRGTALGVLIGALTIGKAFPHLMFGIAGDAAWTTLVRTASVLAIAGGALMWIVVRSGPFMTAGARFEPRAAWRLFTNRRTRLATFGYLGHMWELYAMWTWIAAFATASQAARMHASPEQAGALIAALAIGAGAVGCVVAGLLADRWGQARIAAWALGISGACCVLAGVSYATSELALLVLGTIWGFAVVADSAQFSTLVTRHSDPDHVGTALTMQTCAGFLLTMVSIRMISAAAAAWGWQWVFLLLLPGPLAGIVAMRRLRQGDQEGSTG